jgi:hypothetical protein
MYPPGLKLDEVVRNFGPRVYVNTYSILYLVSNLRNSSKTPSRLPSRSVSIHSNDRLPRVVVACRGQSAHCSSSARKSVDVLSYIIRQALNVAFSGFFGGEGVADPLMEYIVKNVDIHITPIPLVPHAYTEWTADRRVEAERFKLAIGPLVYNYVMYRHFLSPHLDPGKDFHLTDGDAQSECDY